MADEKVAYFLVLDSAAISQGVILAVRPDQEEEINQTLKDSNKFAMAGHMLLKTDSPDATEQETIKFIYEQVKVKVDAARAMMEYGLDKKQANTEIAELFLAKPPGTNQMEINHDHLWTILDKKGWFEGKYGRVGLAAGWHVLQLSEEEAKKFLLPGQQLPKPLLKPKLQDMGRVDLNHIKPQKAEPVATQKLQYA